VTAEWLAAFSDVAFSGGSPDPHFNYIITPEVTPNMDKVTLVIDGQDNVFSATTLKNFTWPGNPHRRQSAAATEERGRPAHHDPVQHRGESADVHAWVSYVQLGLRCG